MSLSMQDVSKKSGFSVSTISLIVNNKRRAKATTARKLEEATGIPREYWLYPDEHQKVLHLLFDLKPYGKDFIQVRK